MKIGNSEVDFKGLLIDGPTGLHSMEPKIMDLLQVLFDNAGQVMTREDLIAAVWGVEYGGDERLSRAISILRKALGDTRGQHKHIATISRVGYRLIADVSHSRAAPIASPLLALPSGSGLKPNPVFTAPKALTMKSLSAIAAFALTCLVAGMFMLSAGKDSGERPQSLQAKMETGFEHIEHFALKGAIHDAQNIFSSILIDDPNHAGARAGLAFALFREYTHLERDPALLQQAKAHAEAALRVNDHLALANIAAAWAAEYEGELARAHAHLDRADILRKNNMLSLEGRYRSFRKEGHAQKAEDVLSSAIAAYPDKALFYSYHGDYLIGIGQLGASERALRKAIALSPDNPRTYAQLSHNLHLQGRTDEAVEVVQQGLGINETPLLYNNLGTYMFFQGQFDLAVSAFEKTLALSGETHNYLYWANLGDAYRWSQEKKEDAATAYRRALQLLQLDLDRYPNEKNHISRAALFNAKLGNLDEAQRYINALKLTAQSPAVQLYSAVVTHEILSDRKEALRCLEVALKANYPLIEVLNDPELSLLRQDPAYHKLLASAKIGRRIFD